MYPPDQVKKLRASFAHHRPTTLRINTLKTSREAFLAQCQELPIVVSPVDWDDKAFTLVEPSLRLFQDSPLYTNGLCYVQSFSSMIPALILNPQANEAILDISAAPGSKTTQMAAMMGNTGSILANDSSRIRLYRLEANCKTLGVTNVTIRHGVGQNIWMEYPEHFDRTLVDVPCSMEGRFVSDDPKSYEHWSNKKVKELAEVQRFLLRAALSATKVGGTIVYSTCTLSPEENEGVIDWILRKEQGNVEVLPIHPNYPFFSESMKEWNTKTFHPDIAHTRRILPSAEFEGFYIALLKKTATNTSRG